MYEPVLQTIHSETRGQENAQLISALECHKAISVHWHNQDDTLHVSTPIEKVQPSIKLPQT